METHSRPPVTDPPRPILALRTKAGPIGYEITLGVPRSLLLRAGQIAFYLLLVYTAVMTAPLIFDSIGVGLDPSWRFACNYFAGSSYKFGPDLVFTYGPLGFIFLPENVGSNLLIALVIRLLIWGLLIALLASAYVKREFSRPACFLAVFCTLLAYPVLVNFGSYMLAAVGLLLIVWESPEEQRGMRVTLALSALAALALLTREAIYVMLMLSFTANFLIAYIRQRRRPSMASLSRFACVIVIPVIAYIAYDRSFDGFLEYLVNGGRMARGFNDAMSLPMPTDQYYRLGWLSALFVGFAACGVVRQWLKLETVACVGAAFFSCMKHSIVRPEGHITFVYAFALILFAILILKSRLQGTRAALVTYCACAGLCVISVTAMNPVWNTLSLGRWNPTPRVDLARSLIHWRQFVADLDAQTEANLQADKLPATVLNKIQRNPVVAFPSELAYGPSNHLDLVPLYTLQAYAASTSELDRATAYRLLERTAPTTRLIVEWKSIDWRHPLLDVPATWEAIYTGYAPELAEPHLLLLKKRPYPDVSRFHPLSRSIANVRQWQDVPNRDHAVRVSASLTPSLWGRVRSFFYTISPVYLELETDHHNSQRFRVAPDVLRYPFVVNCLPLNPTGLELLLFKGTCQQRITRFRFSGEGLYSFSSFGEVAFEEAQDQPFRFSAAKEEIEWQKATVPGDISLFWAGSVDFINERPLPNPVSAANPIKVDSGKPLHIQGWASSNEETGEAFEAVYLILGNQELQALAVLRPDVAQLFRNPRLNNAGFEISVDTSTIPKGVYFVRLVGVTRTKIFYRCPNNIYVRIE